jgi:hypothetical protein
MVRQNLVFAVRRIVSVPSQCCYFELNAATHTLNKIDTTWPIELCIFLVSLFYGPQEVWEPLV